ncbi:hypothetical protein AURDEDRAFT_178040 [Auricularia subglabra TFB-10046 SS5]|uniref:Uncharacterized protein n=1 Tax=Auricularia subglabra (strain TFB-10046 / SS5) TaxID=717982 RepID=J0D2L0_AURST|nr:hypothetical protein AURDEDRAFT_178040 [Auricularia subglabra TFB-10046 SS5]
MCAAPHGVGLLPPTSSLRSPHALSIDAVPSSATPQNLAAHLLARASSSTSRPTSSARPAPRRASLMLSSPPRPRRLLPPPPARRPIASPVRRPSVSAGTGIDIDDAPYDDDADAEGEPETERDRELPLTLTSPSPARSHSLPPTAPSPTLSELLHTFAQLLSMLPPRAGRRRADARRAALRPAPPAAATACLIRVLVEHARLPQAHAAAARASAVGDVLVSEDEDAIAPELFTQISKPGATQNKVSQPAVVMCC